MTFSDRLQNGPDEERRECIKALLNDKNSINGKSQGLFGSLNLNKETKDFYFYFLSSNNPSDTHRYAISIQIELDGSIRHAKQILGEGVEFNLSSDVVDGLITSFQPE